MKKLSATTLWLAGILILTAGCSAKNTELPSPAPTAEESCPSEEPEETASGTFTASGTYTVDGTVFPEDFPADAEQVIFLHPVDLSPLAEYGPFESVAVYRGPDDGLWDLGPLTEVECRILRLGNLRQEDVATLTGGGFDAVQISDEPLSDIGFLDRLPQVTSLLMTVSGNQPEEVLPYFSGTACPPEALRLLNTPVPAEQLLAFAERGNVYLFSESRR